jgi:hypothetical protein
VAGVQQFPDVQRPAGPEHFRCPGDPFVLGDDVPDPAEGFVVEDALGPVFVGL